jgi:hypothetical protein
MSDPVHAIVQVLQEPAVQEALQHGADGFLSRFGGGAAGILVDKIRRFVAVNNATDGPETVVIVVERLEKLYLELADQVARNDQRLDVEILERAFNDPQGARTLTAAHLAATETEDPETLSALAALLRLRIASESGSQLALRVRQATDTVRELRRRELDTLALITVIATTVTPPPHLMQSQKPKEPPSRAEFAEVSAWYENQISKVDVFGDEGAPLSSDVWQLEALGLIRPALNAAEYEARTPPHGGRMAGIAATFGIYQEPLPAAMGRLHEREFGLAPGRFDRAFERPALGAYHVTEAGLLLGTLTLAARGVPVGTDFSTWGSV